MDQKPPQTNKNGSKRSESDTKVTETGTFKKRRAIRVMKKYKAKRNGYYGRTSRRY